MKKKKSSTLEGHTDSVRCLVVPQETPIFYQWEKIKLLPTDINKPSLDLSERSARIAQIKNLG